MSARRLCILLSTLALLLALSCAKPSGPQVKTGEEFTLAPGQSITVTDANLRLSFVKVTADSRCPTGAQCIVAGQVDCQIEITRTNAGATPVQATITQGGSTQEPAEAVIDGYELTYNVTPYPAVGKTIASSEYRLVATLSKS